MKRDTILAVILLIGLAFALKFIITPKKEVKPEQPEFAEVGDDSDVEEMDTTTVVNQDSVKTDVDSTIPLEKEVSVPKPLARTWKISTGNNIEFSSEDASGIFKTLSGNIRFSTDDLEMSKFDLKIKVSSINTGNGMQNKHAIGGDWFDATKYPYMTFTSTNIVKTKSGYKAIGKLKIKNTTKTVSIPFRFESNTFIGGFRVNRVDYGVGSDDEVSRTIKINFSIPVTKK